MADLMNVARTGVEAAQKRLNVVSNNIANVGTDGYHRQVLEQRSRESERYGPTFIGSGTYVNDINRVYNTYAERELTMAASQHSNSATTHEQLDRLDNILSKAGMAVPNSINSLAGTFSSLVDMPMESSLRQNTLSAADQAAKSFKTLSNELKVQVDQVNDQIKGTIDQVNSLSTELAEVNVQLLAIGGRDPQLLDHQDRLINQLSEYMQVSVIPQKDGVKSVMAGGTVMLVAGPEAMKLGLTNGDPVQYETRLTMTSVGQTGVVPDNQDMGGIVQSLLDYRNNDLANARSQLDLMALGMADAYNQQQAKGFDLNGNVGKAMFTELNEPDIMRQRVAPYTNNTGDQQLAVAIDDTSALTGERYTLNFDGSQYQLTNSAGANVALTQDPNNSERFLTDQGFSFQANFGTPQAGDRWDLLPANGAAGSIEMTLASPHELAAAGYGLTVTSGSGDAQLVSVDRSNSAFPARGETLTVTVDPASNSFVIDHSNGSQLTGALVDNQVQAFGMVLQLGDNSASGDQYQLDLSFGPADNANALALSGITAEKRMFGGTFTLHDIYEGLKNNNGARASAASIAAESASILKAQAKARVEEGSGVNLDDEAADLMRFQQAYNASARVMTVAKETFDTLFASIR